MYLHKHTVGARLWNRLNRMAMLREWDWRIRLLKPFSMTMMMMMMVVVVMMMVIMMRDWRIHLLKPFSIPHQFLLKNLSRKSLYSIHIFAKIAPVEKRPFINLLFFLLKCWFLLLLKKTQGVRKKYSPLPHPEIPNPNQIQFHLNSKIMFVIVFFFNLYCC